MSDKRQHRTPVCGICARVTQRDISRGFCPVSLSHIRSNRPAENCKYFVESEDWDDGRGRGRRHVR